MSVTFQASDQQVCQTRLATTSINESITSIYPNPYESWSKIEKGFVKISSANKNPFLYAVGEAYNNHYPLILSPDIIWFQISSSLATHIHQDPEKYRHLFVDHDGKKKIFVRRDDFVKGKEDNPWPEVFTAFTDQIKKSIGDEMYDTIISNFSTTTPLEKSISEIVLMDVVKDYFELRFRTMCGIPSITLEGTLQDWNILREKADKLRQFDLSWWIDALNPVLDQFVQAYQGNVDRTFWESFFKKKGGSGGPYVTGWINVFFPYLKNNRRNNMNWKAAQESHFGGTSPSSIPFGFSKAEFVWEYYNTNYNMNFMGGFVGVSQNDNMALKPELGWIISESPGGM